MGILEDVISRMEQDTSGEWTGVMFVPPGQLSTRRDAAGQRAKGTTLKIAA